MKPSHRRSLPLASQQKSFLFLLEENIRRALIIAEKMEMLCRELGTEAVWDKENGVLKLSWLKI